jgi:hypothetical protein
MQAIKRRRGTHRLSPLRQGATTVHQLINFMATLGFMVRDTEACRGQRWAKGTTGTLVGDRLSIDEPLNTRLPLEARYDQLRRLAENFLGTAWDAADGSIAGHALRHHLATQPAVYEEDYEPF